MLLRNKEPFVTKNQDFSRHLPSKEGSDIPQPYCSMERFCNSPHQRSKEGTGQPTTAIAVPLPISLKANRDDRLRFYIFEYEKHKQTLFI